MELTKEKKYGIIGSILFYTVLLLILYFTFLRTEVKAKEEGVLVNFGSVNLAAGTFTPKGEVKEAAPQEANPSPPAQETSEIPQPQSPKVSQPKPQTKPQAKLQPKPTPPPITQSLEQTAAIEAAKQKQREKAASEQAVREAARAEQARLAEEQRKRDAISRQVSEAFGAGNSSRSGQGNPQGAPTTAQSGSDYGEFNLGGRTLGAGGLPRPEYPGQEYGDIVINISVNPQGIVVRAEIGKGTTIVSEALRKLALEAAKKAKFNSINGTGDQQGTITYKYRLK